MRIICVDSQRQTLDFYRGALGNIEDIESLEMFDSPKAALNWAAEHETDVVIMDTELSGMNGIELAQRLRAYHAGIRIIYVTAQTQYALDAFRVDAIGYVLKPCSTEALLHELGKAARMKDIPSKRVVIQTIPSFVVFVDGEPLHFERGKPEELLALLIDRAEAGITPGDAIACLWPDRNSDEATMTLYRVTFHRLMSILKDAGIDSIIGRRGRKRFICKEQIDCDIYRLLDGNANELMRYNGEYMRDYSWAEVRNAQLTGMKPSLY